jgi:quinol monooxygenase YgiN
MIVNTAKITVYPEKRAEFLQTVAQLLEPLKGAKGCLNFRLYVDVTDENSSLLISEWETELDLCNYQTSSDFAVLHGAITVLGLSSSDFNAVANELSNTQKARGV